MKNTTYLDLSKLFLLSFTILFFQSCDQSNTKTLSINSAIPKLLDRNEKIQLDKEWEFVQNFYATQKKALSNDPANNDAKLNLVQLFIKEARVTGEHGHYYPAALKLVNEISDSKPQNPDLIFRTLMTKAGVELSLHEFEKALQTGQQAIALNPNNAQIHGVLVDANVELGNYQKAVELADRMVNIKPDIRSYSRISYLREIHGDVDGAIQAMNMAAKSGFPGYEETAWSMLTLGELYAQYGELEKAEKVFEAILQSRSNYPFAIGALADIYYQKGDQNKAEKTLNEAIDIIPEVGFYIQLAQLYKDQNRTAEFEKTIDEIFVMLQDDVDHGHNMNLEYASLYLDLLNDTNKAYKYAHLEYQKRPKNIDVNRLLAKIHRTKNDLEKTKIFTAAAAITNSVHPELLALQNKTD